MHSQKPHPVIHRDLKCDNIFVSSSTGDVRIGDLGLSTFMKNSHNKTILGTPQYMAPELYEERYGTSVDIYSFGLCILEMCTHSTPYAECKTPVEIYNKVISGRRPLAFDRILDLEVKEFIELCLSPVDQRPFADELLNNHFLIIEENDDKVHLPVSLKPEDEISPIPNKSDKDQDTPTIMDVQSLQNETEYEQNEIKIELKIGFRDLVARKIVPTKIDFIYNTLNDTPEGITEEIITTFNVDSSYSSMLSKIIRDKIIENFKENEFEKEILRGAQSLDIENGKHSEVFECQLPPFKDILSKNNSENPKQEVIILQKALFHLTGEKITVDGIFSIRTDNAVKKYQESLGLPVDGIVKKNLWDQIMLQDAKKTKNELIRRDIRVKRLNTCPINKNDEKFK